MFAPKPLRVFVSYSHADQSLRGELDKHLAPLKRLGTIEQWHDQKIGAGTDWEAEIEEKLNSADLILLLVSADFIASDYCYLKEMQRALERHRAKQARVIPIILRPCDWQLTPLRQLQVLPSGGEPITRCANADQAFADVAQGIRAILKELNAGQRQQRNVLWTMVALVVAGLVITMALRGLTGDGCRKVRDRPALQRGAVQGHPSGHVPGGGREPESVERPLAHMVVFRLKDASPAEKESLVRSCWDHLSQAEGAIACWAGIVDASEQQGLDDEAFDVVWYSIFQTRTYYDRFVETQENSPFVGANREKWAEVRVFDFYLSAPVNVRSFEEGGYTRTVFFKLIDDSRSAREQLVESCDDHFRAQGRPVDYWLGTIASDVVRDICDREFDVALHQVYADKQNHDALGRRRTRSELHERNRKVLDTVRVFCAVRTEQWSLPQR
jgi:hypothetical protein